jgi:hypothetical protein
VLVLQQYQPTTFVHVGAGHMLYSRELYTKSIKNYEYITGKSIKRGILETQEYVRRFLHMLPYVIRKMVDYILKITKKIIK